VRKYVGGLALVGSSFKIGGKDESLASFFFFFFEKYICKLMFRQAL
jgi:hypothetical protein